MSIKLEDLLQIRADLEDFAERLAKRAASDTVGDAHEDALRDVEHALDRARILLIKQPDYKTPPWPTPVIPGLPGTRRD